MIETLNPKSEVELEELLKVRNESNLLGLDVVAAWRIRAGMLEPGFQFGEHNILKYGGLQSGFIFMEQLKILAKETPLVIKDDTGKICGSFLCATNLTSGTGVSKQESVLFGKNSEHVLNEDLICRNQEEQENRDKTLEILKNGTLAYGATVFVKKAMQRSGFGFDLKLRTYEHLVKQNKTWMFYRIFEIEGIYKTQNSEYELVYKFDPTIQNVRNISMAKLPAVKPLGIIPMYKRVTEMVDNIVTPEKTRTAVSKMLAIHPDAVDSYCVKINNMFFLLDLKATIEDSKKLHRGKEHICGIEREQESSSRSVC